MFCASLAERLHGQQADSSSDSNGSTRTFGFRTGTGHSTDVSLEVRPTLTSADDAPYFGSGSPSTRFEITFRFTSEVPPSMEFALDRSQPRVTVFSNGL